MKPAKRALKLILLAMLLLPPAGYFTGSALFRRYIDSGAGRLLELEKGGRLSRTYGYVWQQINTNNAMKRSTAAIKSKKTAAGTALSTADSVYVNLPSLSAVAEFNAISHLDKSIRITDRNGIPLAVLKTVHTSVCLDSINSLLLKSLLMTEDKHFYERKRGYDLNAILRSFFTAAIRSIRSFSLSVPRGSSTIHMQVARFLLMNYDSRGYAYTEKSIQRKLFELKLAQALSLTYTKDEILTFYTNHCVSAGRGMVGYHDISIGLFGVSPDKLSIPQSLYCARLVKWNRQVPRKIIQQIKISMPELAGSFSWDALQQKRITEQLDSLTFREPAPLFGNDSYLIDYANEHLRTICQKKGMSSSELAEMDIADPESMIRQFGNATIQLTIDYRLQKLLEKAVRSRGFAPDTTLISTVQIGCSRSVVVEATPPPDTIKQERVLSCDTTFVDAAADASLVLKKGDTVLCSIQYKRAGNSTVHRIITVYRQIRRSVPGQYYSYALMDSKTRCLLAYCSTDRLGSRLRSLLVNRTPNGSSTAKPISYALAYDLGVYKPSDMTSDDLEIPDTCLWERAYLYDHKREPVGMLYRKVKERGGYPVRNHGQEFGGYDFLFNHLANSNNIVAVETMYRLSTDLAGNSPLSRDIVSFVDRIGRKDLAAASKITGPQLYTAMVSVVRDKAINEKAWAENYSVALGTFELSLYEQLHLFNALYSNELVAAPWQHPSLFIKRVTLSGSAISFTDNISSKKIFKNMDNIRPVHLALHKRLISNAADRLSPFDICTTAGWPPGNFAKSGTTDDILRPFNAADGDSSKTNYGLWNAVVRLRLTRETLQNMVRQDTLVGRNNDLHIPYGDIPVQEDCDVTVACIGECNEQYTGARDGKTLHSFITRELLHTFGVPCTSGFYTAYERELISQTPEKVRYCGGKTSNLSFFSRTVLKLQTGVGGSLSVDEVIFEPSPNGTTLYLKGKHLKKMLRFALYMGDSAKEYRDLVKRLRKTDDKKEARDIINKISALKPGNQMVKRDVDRACASLLKSIGTGGE